MTRVLANFTEVPYAPEPQQVDPAGLGQVGVASVLEGGPGSVLPTENEKPPFDEVFSKFYHGIVGYFAQTDPSTVEDRAQEVFMHAWIAYDGFKCTYGDPSVASWLRKIARNVGVSAGRAAEVRPKIIGSGSEAIMENMPAAANPESLAMDRLIIRAFMVTAGVSSRRKAMLVMSEMGYKQAEIAAAFGVTVGTVKSTISKARETAREALGSLFSG